MIPTTALVMAALGFAVLLALDPNQSSPTHKRRSSFVIGLSLALILMTSGALLEHLFAIPTGINLNFIFKSVPHSAGILSGGNLSIQSALAGLFLSLSIFLHLSLAKIEHRLSGQVVERVVVVIQILPLLTLGICCLAGIGYLQNIWRYFGSSKYVGLSLPSIISFLLLTISALQLRRHSGYIGLVLSEGAAGLFLRRFLMFSVWGPMIITAIIAWGEANSLYPDSFSLGLFVIFTISTLIATSFITAAAIKVAEDQRIDIETAKGRVALQETEESLRETRNRLQFALDASGMGTWELDLTGSNQVLWSETTEILFGLQPASFSGRNEDANAMIDPQDREPLERAREAAIAEHRDLDFDFRAIRPDGLTRWLRLKGRASYDAAGLATKISGTILDITREKLDQKAIEDALQAAQSANDLKSNFLASMSHEIRTPLGAILGFTELLRDPSTSTAERDEYLKVITRNGETLSQLINDILDLSKVEAGHMNIENIRFSVKNVVEEVTALLRNKAEKKGIEISIRFGDTVPEQIVSDPIRLKQILFNLVGNAIKFTPRGRISIEITSQDRKVIFDVRDTGIGIKPEQREYLFRPFIQADGSITRRFGGTGLGLSLSRNLAGLLGGDVELRSSSVSEGSVFRAWIEDRENGAELEKPKSLDLTQRTTTLEKDKVSLDGLKILVVDDSLDNQNLIENILKKRGAHLDFAGDGQDAVQKISESQYDIVLMDIQMPILDGFAATEQARKNGFQGPIVALTAHAMKDTHADCLRVGCSAYLSKPINSRSLLTTIHQLTRTQSANS